MSVPVVKFNPNDQPEFFAELRKRVNQYFKDKNISKQANLAMKVKTAFMICLYTIPLVLILTGVVSSLWGIYGMMALMGFGIAGIGLAIMHDANHGAYSKNQTVNKALGYILNYVGGYHINWKIQHNVLHHSFTNVQDFDEDIETAVMRFAPTQPWKPSYRFQAYYATFFYGLMTFYWVISKDIEQLIRYQKKGLLSGQGLSFGKAMAELIFNKLWYIGLTVVLPIMILDITWWQYLLGFFMMHFIGGLLLAFIFQPAHVVEETEFYHADENGSVDNHWAIHQMRTTANFANDNIFLSWFVGGLNFQIEHHLFPNICHIHYKALSPIVKATAEEFNVPYNQHKTWYGALKSHYSLLNDLGTGAYDKRVAAATA